VLAAGLVVVGAAIGINAYYGQSSMLHAVARVPPGGRAPIAAIPPVVSSPYQPRPGQPLVEGWRPPSTMPTKGVITQVAIASPVSGFAATRDAYVYLPPAYLVEDRPLLPVLMLLHGQPGSPSNWIDDGQIGAMMDAFAAGHHGLAPVVVAPDATGAESANPMCLDSALGNSESYLTKDVPNWIRENLQVDEQTQHWAVAGFSYGGTCSLQLALRRPDLFPTFIDMSGQREPTLGTRAETVDAAFGGDEERFREVNPLDELATKTFPDTAGRLIVGSADSEYLPQLRDVYAACLQYGLNVRWQELPGGHEFQVWAGGLQGSLEWLAARTGLVGS
jgi:enterochelin esterase-like enzyme